MTRRCAAARHIDVAAVGIEIAAASGRVKYLQPGHAIGLAQRVQGLAFGGDFGVHRNASPKWNDPGRDR